MNDCFSKNQYFQKPRITVSDSSQWQVSVISVFEERRCRLLKRLIWGKGGLRLQARRIAPFFKASFS